jgi:hypothetical protein
MVFLALLPQIRPCYRQGLQFFAVATDEIEGFRQLQLVKQTIYKLARILNWILFDKYVAPIPKFMYGEDGRV